jgi:NTE family protein
MTAKNYLGVSLSGGGYRAAAFHLGTLRALKGMGILNKVDVLSTISGGSITGAYYCLYKGNYAAFETDMINRLQTANVIREVLLSRSFVQLCLFTLVLLGPAIYLLFTPYAWSFLILFAAWIFLLLKFQFRLFPAGKEVEGAYDKFYYQGAVLNDLCKRPVLAIGSSNLQTGRPFTFSWRKMGDSGYNVRFKHAEFPVARAVTASSCVPFAFTPVSIKRKFFEVEADANKVDPKLIDGGVYDNQGIQKLTQQGSSYECEVVITSDAGGKLSFNNRYVNTVGLLIRTVDLFMNRIKSFQMVDNIYHNIRAANRQIAYLSLGWDLDRCITGFADNMEEGLIAQDVINAHQFQPEWIQHPATFRDTIIQHLKQAVGYEAINARNLTAKQLDYARDTSTNLTPLTRERIHCLITHAANLTELQVKLYCPLLIPTYEPKQL